MVRVLMERGAHAWVAEGHAEALSYAAWRAEEVEVVLDQR